MTIAPVAHVKARFSAYLDQARRLGPIVITRNGRAVAVLLAPVDEDDLESIVLARSPRFQGLLAKSRKSIQAGRGVPRAAFWKSVERRAEKVAKRPNTVRPGRR